MSARSSGSPPSLPGKVFQCDTCGKCFSSGRNLRRHAANHAGKEFKCSLCPKEYSRSDLLLRHVRSHTSKEADPLSDPLPAASTSAVPYEPSPAGPAFAPVDSIMTDRNHPVLSFQDQLSQLAAVNGLWPELPQQQLDLHSIGQDALQWSNWDNWDNSLSWLLEGTISRHPSPGPSTAANLPATNGSAMTDSQSSSLHALANVAVQITTPSEATESPSETTTGQGDHGPAHGSRDESWPQHFDPAASSSTSALVGAQAQEKLQELSDPLESDLVWQRFFIDQDVLNRMFSVIDLARFMPGATESREALPKSTHTVNHLLACYFTHVSPIFPVLHLPTFSTTKAAPLLLFAMVGSGAIFSGLSGSSKLSLTICELTRRALAALFEHDLVNLRSEPIMHAMLLTCVSALWSGNKRAFELAEIQRGQLVNLCRRGGLLDQPTFRQANGLNLTWEQWAAVESRKRLGVAILLLDGFFPSLLNTPSYISQGELAEMLLPCDDKYWRAATARQWESLLGMAPIPPATFFSSCQAALLTPPWAEEKLELDPALSPFSRLVLMTSIHHHIYELRVNLLIYNRAKLSVRMYEPKGGHLDTKLASGFLGRKTWLLDALKVWSFQAQTETASEPLTLWANCLYHLALIALNVSITDLHDAAGQHGDRVAAEARKRLAGWAMTDDAVTAAHAAVSLLHILRHAHSHTIGPFGPLCSFNASLTLAAWISNTIGTGSQARLADQPQQTLLTMLGLDSLDQSAAMSVRKFGAAQVGSMAWGVSSSLQSILLRDNN